MFYLRDVFIFVVVLLALGFASASVWRHSWSLSRAEAIALSSVLVLGSTALLVWLMGNTIGINLGLWFCFLLPCVVLITLSRRKSIKAPREGGFWSLDFAETTEEKFLALYLVLVGALSFLLTLAPPSGLDYDSLVYHFAAPAQYIRHGRIVELPYDSHTYFPFTMEMLYLLGLVTSGPVLAKLFHWIMLPLACLALFGLGSRYLSRRAGWYAAALWASLPIVFHQSTTGYVDLALATFTLLAFLGFVRWWQDAGNRDVRWLWLSGAFCGLCLGVKYLGALTFVWLGASALFIMARSRQWQPHAIAGFAAAALLFGGVWYVRNIVWTGNPVFPYAYGVFGGKGWSAALAADYGLAQTRYGFGRSLIDYVYLPWRVAMAPLNAKAPFWPISSGTPGSDFYFGTFDSPALDVLISVTIGPILLALGAPLLFAGGKPSVAKFAGWTILVSGVAWAVSAQQARFLLPTLIIICAACGWGVSRYFQRSQPLRWTVAVGVVAWLLFGPLLMFFQKDRELGVAVGGMLPQEYLARTLAPYRAQAWINDNVPPTARVAVYGEPRCYYLNRDYFWADSFHNTLIDYSKIANGAQLVAALKAQGATHILVNTEPGKNAGVGEPPAQLGDAEQNGNVRQLATPSQAYHIYELQ